jgi:hypothetical protein
MHTNSASVPSGLHPARNTLQTACATPAANEAKMTQNKIVTTGAMAGRAGYPPGASLPSLSDSLPQAHNRTDAICDHVYCFMWVHVTEGKGTRAFTQGSLHKENMGRADTHSARYFTVAACSYHSVPDI